MATPTLNIGIIETHSLETIAVMDLSKYPPSYNITSPTLQITPPGYEPVSLAFTPNSLQLYQSSNLGIVCESCSEVQIPDGIWTLTYTITPANVNKITKTIVRVDRLQAKFDEAFISMDVSHCDDRVRRDDKMALALIETYIESAVAAGNKCLNKLFNTLYMKATDLINNFINSKSCATH